MGGAGVETETSTLEEGGGGGDCDRGSASERGICLAAERFTLSSGTTAGLGECTRAHSALSCFIAAKMAALSM